MEWKIDNEQGEYLYIVEDQGKRWDNPVVCQLYEDVTPEDSVTIGNWYESFPNAEANARLIAAAPDLLEALERFSTYIIFDQCDCQSPGCLGTCDSAIAKKALLKAKGEMK